MCLPHVGQTTTQPLLGVFRGDFWAPSRTRGRTPSISVTCDAFSFRNSIDHSLHKATGLKILIVYGTL